MLRELADGLWVIDHDFSMPGGIEIGARTSVVRLGDGGLFVHSPGPLGAAEQGELRERGPVRALVAPNLFHHLFLEQAATAFPQAALYGVAGVERKLPALRLEPLGDEPDPLWKDDLAQLRIEGAPRLGEVVFFHPRSRTLLLTDLCFHILRARRMRTRVLLRVMNAWGRFGPSRLLRSLVKDRRAVRAGIDRILEWDFDRVIVTHGDIVETGGREALRGAFDWL